MFLPVEAVSSPTRIWIWIITREIPTTFSIIICSFYRFIFDYLLEQTYRQLNGQLDRHGPWIRPGERIGEYIFPLETSVISLERQQNN